MAELNTAHADLPLTIEDLPNPAVPLLRGRGLRFVLVDHLMECQAATVAELVAVVEGAGFVLEGRPSKLISDALRWEAKRGRVVRADPHRVLPESTAPWEVMGWVWNR